MKTSEVLHKARNLIQDVGWTQGVNARDEYGNSCNSRSERAVRYCSMGAILKTPNIAETIYHRAFFLIAESAKCESIADWNDADGRTKKEVIAVFDQAIELAKKEEMK